MSYFKFAFFLALILLSLFVKAHAATISGFVNSKSNGEPIAYASIIVQQTEQGTTTNKKGYYVLNNLPVGQYTLLVTHVAHRPFQTDVTINTPEEEFFLKIELEKTARSIKGISVSTEKYAEEVNTKVIEVSKAQMLPEAIAEVPQIAEADVFRSVLSLPGVTPISDYSSGLYVRGGSPDQNLILLDDIDVYNPSHFGGIFSTFNTDAVENVELIKGGYPVQYGGRLSSVLDVTNREGNRKQWQGVGRVSLISTSLTAEGPWHIGTEGGSCMLSFRRSYFELVKAAIDGMPDYYFYDSHARINWDASEKDKVSLSAYLGRDVMGMDMGGDFNMDGGNQTISAQWTHIFTPQLFSHFTLAGSRMESIFKVDYDSGQSLKRSNEIQDATLKGRLSYQPNSQHQLDFGFEEKYNNISLRLTGDNSYDPDHMPNFAVGAINSSFYIQDSYDPNVFWTIQPGLRITNSSTVENELDNSPDANNTRISPYIAVRRKLDTNSNIYFNYGRYYQFLTYLSYGAVSTMDMWFPLDGSIKPGESDHFIAGYRVDWKKGVGLDLEAYYKLYRNLVEYNYDTEQEWSNQTSTLNDILHIGKGWSTGVDAMLRTDWKGLQGFIGYSFGITKRRMRDVNINPDSGDPEYYYPTFDRTHQVNVVQTYHLTETTGRQVFGADFNIGTKFTFSTGQPTDKPEKIFYTGDSYQFLYSYSDRERLPNYSRLDLSFRWRYEKKHYTIEPYLECINVLNTKNVWYRNYTVNTDDNGVLHVKPQDAYMFPRLPFIGVNIEW